MIDRLYPGLEGCHHFSATKNLNTNDLLRSIEAFQPDVVHLIAVGQTNIHRIKRHLAQLPWLLTIHSVSPHEKVLRTLHGNDRLHYLLRNIKCLPQTLATRILVGHADIPRIIVHSDFMRNELQKLGSKPTGVSIVNLAVDQAHNSPSSYRTGFPAEAPQLMTVAGISHSKGLHDGLEVVRMLKSDFPTILYRIIGETRDETYLQFLEHRIRQFDLTNNVELIKNAPEATRIRLLAETDLYIQPSHEEGFCLSFLEAALSVPRVIGSDTGAIKEICDGHPGMAVVPPMSPQEMIIAARALLTQPINTEQMTYRVRNINAKFSIDRYIRQHETIYAYVAAQGIT